MSYCTEENATKNGKSKTRDREENKHRLVAEIEMQEQEEAAVLPLPLLLSPGKEDSVLTLTSLSLMSLSSKQGGGGVFFFIIFVIIMKCLSESEAGRLCDQSIMSSILKSAPAHFSVSALSLLILRRRGLLRPNEPAPLSHSLVSVLSCNYYV